MSGYLLQTFLYLLAAVIAVPVAKRLGLGSVLGYLIAGILIGPVLGLVGSETEELQHFAEFGVVMMLFLVGLELEPKALWSMRTRLIGLGGLQVVLTALLVAAAALALGQAWQMALAVGLVLSLSSTAIVLQTLNEKRLMKSEGGQASFSVLLFQDIAVIPMLALIPLLAVPELIESMNAVASGGPAEAAAGHDGGHAGSGGHDTVAEAGEQVMSRLAGWQVALLNVAAVGVVVGGGMYLSRPLFRYIARAQLREVFTAAALLLVIGIALLMTLVGLSPALGTFLAGVVLANSEYRHELESDIEPFKGLLLGLFFITVGAGIDFGILSADLVVIVGLTIALIAAKAIVLFFLSVLFSIRGRHRWLFMLSLAQAGEFGFVLISLCLQNQVLPAALADRLLLVVALSMLLTPALFILLERVVVPRLPAEPRREDDEITEQGTAIIAGHGRFGQVVNRMLASNGFKTVVLDTEPDLVDGLRKFDIEVFFGDASRPDLLASAGLAETSLLVVALDDRERANELIAHARRERPDLHIISRAFDRRHVYELYKSGTNDIVRETFDSATRAGRYALEALGMHPVEAENATRHYVRLDRRGIRRLAQVYRPGESIFENTEYRDMVKQIRDEMDRVMSTHAGSRHDDSERGWQPPGNSAMPKSDDDKSA